MAELNAKIIQAETLLTTTGEGPNIGQFAIGAKSLLGTAKEKAQIAVDINSHNKELIKRENVQLTAAIDTYRQSAHFNHIENWVLLAELSDNQAHQMVAEEEVDLTSLLSGKPLSDVVVYKLNYHTVDVEGTDILASGVIMFAKDISELPLVSFQHGSLYRQNDAPSAYNQERLLTNYGIAMATTGYAVIMPDYLGYGSSSIYPHPDEHGITLASASFDMLLASKEFFESNGVSLSDKLFITGYSEGGYATMALHKHIEDNSDITVTMSAPASGSYNKTAFYKEMMALDKAFEFPGSPMWVIDSYNWIFGLNRQWSDYINEPYASTMEGIAHPFDYIEAAIAKNPQDLYTDKFREGILNGTDTEYLEMIAQNDYFNWSPKAPITLYYGNEDDWVFPTNSTTAFEALKANGANVNIVAYLGKNHFTAAAPYLIDVYQLFESLK